MIAKGIRNLVFEVPGLQEEKRILAYNILIPQKVHYTIFIACIMVSVYHGNHVTKRFLFHKGQNNNLKELIALSLSQCTYSSQSNDHIMCLLDLVLTLGLLVSIGPFSSLVSVVLFLASGKRTLSSTLKVHWISTQGSQVASLGESPYH